MTGELKYVRKVGTGAYGRVYLVQTEEGKLVAMKRNLADSTTDFFAAIREYDFASRNPRAPFHPYLINFLQFENAKRKLRGKQLSPIPGKEYHDDSVHMVFEPAECDLSCYIDNTAINRGEKLQRLKYFLVHMLCALDYYHYNGIAHRDLKPANFLIVEQKEGKVLKLSDFAMAKHVTYQDRPTTYVSSAYYRSPETLRGHHSTTMSDIWSLGTILFQMFTSGILFNCKPEDLQHDEKIYQYQVKVIKDDKVTKEMNKLPPQEIRFFDSLPGPKWSQLIQLINDCLQFDPHKRPTINDILSRPEFSIYSPHVNELHKYFPRYNLITNLKMCDTTVRTNVLKKLIAVYPSICKEQWFRMRSLFMTVDIFDRYLAFNKEQAEKKKENLVDEANAVFVLAICFYLSINFHAITNMPLRMKDINKKIVGSEIENLEQTSLAVAEYILHNVARPGDIYHRTVYEMADEDKIVLTDDQGFDLLKFYCSNSKYEGKTVRDIYQDWKKSNAKVG